MHACMMIRQVGILIALILQCVAAGTVPNGSSRSESEEKGSDCTVVNVANNAFYDLSSLSRSSMEKNIIKPAAWPAKGFDYGVNFTLGICASPLSAASARSSHDVDSSIQNASRIGGYYVANGIKYSIGNFNTTPVLRGKKLTLTYANGSYCRDPNSLSADEYLKDSKGKRLRKSTILSFACDKEILSKASVSFIGAINNCAYFFEVRTAHACVTPKKADDLAAIWIFFFILFAALSVYFSGGFLYKLLFRHKKVWKNNIKNNPFKNSFVSNYRDGRVIQPTHNSSSYSDYDDTNRLLDQLDINLDTIGDEESNISSENSQIRNHRL